MSQRIRSLAFAGVLAAALCARPETSAAWEAATTHAGLAERAALGSRLDQRLRTDLGLERGLFSALIVPPADAAALFQVLATLNPVHGYVPDARGRLLALGWLAAGAVVADIPPAHAAHHFFDPTIRSGLTDVTLQGLGTKLRLTMANRRAGESIVRTGMPAPDWVVSADNPMGLGGFLDQYAKAVRARTPAERERHVAGALLAAGAILHVLQDMGSPSHVRNDLAEHLDVIGNDNLDVGSRFERIAALAYGRLGVPGPDRTVTAPDLRSFFTAADGSGLADRTARRWFSAYTLPRPVRIQPGTGGSAIAELVAKALPRPAPAPSARLDIDAAGSFEGARLTDAEGVCLASYRIQESVLSWYRDDDCMAEQVAAILPEVASYSTGLLDWLFRGSVALERTDSGIAARAGGVELGKGTVELYWDDSRGVRTQAAEAVNVDAAASGELLARLPALPKDAVSVAVLFRGQDKNGQPLIAPGYLRLR